MKTALSAAARLSSDDAEVELLGLRSRHPKLVIQLVTMKKLPNAKAVRMVAAQTLRALETDALLASKPEVDLLLRLSGTAQIAPALKEHGYKARGKKVLVAAGRERDLRRLKLELSKRDEYELLGDREVDEEGLQLVEAAALIGARS